MLQSVGLDKKDKINKKLITNKFSLDQYDNTDGAAPVLSLDEKELPKNRKGSVSQLSVQEMEIIAAKNKKKLDVMNLSMKKNGQGQDVDTPSSSSPSSSSSVKIKKSIGSRKMSTVGVMNDTAGDVGGGGEQDNKNDDKKKLKNNGEPESGARVKSSSGGGDGNGPPKLSRRQSVLKKGEVSPEGQEAAAGGATTPKMSRRQSTLKELPPVIDGGKKRRESMAVSNS